jgi:hypothetical protein
VGRRKGPSRRLAGALKSTWKDAWQEPEKPKNAHMVCPVCATQKPKGDFPSGNPYRCKDCGGKPIGRGSVTGGLPSLGKRRR